MSSQACLLAVVYTLLDGNRIRLISARKATRNELISIRDEYNFSKGKRAENIPHLAELQRKAKGKSRIIIMPASEVLSAFRARAKAEGVGYQTLINATLREAIGSRPVDEETILRILREELKAS